MKLRGAGPLAPISRWRRERRGLEAIFSSEDTGRQGEVVAGLAGILVGQFLLILAVFPLVASQILGPFTNTVYSSLTFAALGLLLLVCAGGTFAFGLTPRKTNSSTRGGTMTVGPFASDSSGETLDRNEKLRMLGPGSRIGAVAFFQSLALVVLYSGLVQEFRSNSTMQVWINSDFPVGQSVLNWEGVMLLSVSLGLLLLQFLPGRFFSER